MCDSGGVVYPKEYRNTTMRIQNIEYPKYRYTQVDGKGTEHFPLYSAIQGDKISTGKTASEAINNLLVNIYGI